MSGHIAVIDSYALVAVSETCRPMPECAPVFHKLTENLNAGTLIFSDETLKECRRLADSEQATIWANAAAGNRNRLYKAPQSYMEKVLVTCPDLIDADDDAEQPQLSVATIAAYLTDCATDTRVLIVTEDRNDPPGRISLHSASVELGFESVDLRTYLGFLGLASCLV